MTDQDLIRQFLFNRGSTKCPTAYVAAVNGGDILIINRDGNAPSPSNIVAEKKDRLAKARSRAGKETAKTSRVMTESQQSAYIAMLEKHSTRRNKLVEEFMANPTYETVLKLANENNTRTDSIRSQLKKSGVCPELLYKARGDKRPGFMERYRKAKDLFMSGKTVLQIAEELGISDTTVRDALHKMGVGHELNRSKKARAYHAVTAEMRQAG